MHREQLAQREIRLVLEVGEGEEKADEFGRRNAVAGELLLRLTPDSTVAMRAVAD